MTIAEDSDAGLPEHLLSFGPNSRNVIVPLGLLPPLRIAVSKIDGDDRSVRWRRWRCVPRACRLTLPDADDLIAGEASHVLTLNRPGET